MSSNNKPIYLAARIDEAASTSNNSNDNTSNNTITNSNLISSDAVQNQNVPDGENDREAYGYNEIEERRPVKNYIGLLLMAAAALANKPCFLGRLTFEGTTFFMGKRSVKIGRNVTPSKFWFNVGTNKKVARKHLLIFYYQKHFYVTCFSKNGIFIDQTFIHKTRSPLRLPISCNLTFPQTNVSIAFENLVCADRYETNNPNPSDSAIRTSFTRELQTFIPLPSRENVRPQYTMVQLIVQSFEAALDKPLTIPDIYRYIEHNYPYYRKRSKKWWRSVINPLLISDKNIIQITRPYSSETVWCLKSRLSPEESDQSSDVEYSTPIKSSDIDLLLYFSANALKYSPMHNIASTIQPGSFSK